MKVHISIKLCVVIRSNSRLSEELQSKIFKLQIRVFHYITFYITDDLRDQIRQISTQERLSFLHETHAFRQVRKNFPKKYSRKTKKFQMNWISQKRQSSSSSIYVFNVGRNDVWNWRLFQSLLFSAKFLMQTSVFKLPIPTIFFQHFFPTFFFQTCFQRLAPQRCRHQEIFVSSPPLVAMYYTQLGI